MCVRAVAYEESLLKAFARTLSEEHPVVIVDAPLLRAARLHQFWTTAQVLSASLPFLHAYLSVGINPSFTPHLTSEFVFKMK